MNVQQDVSTLLRARNTLLWVTTREEQRAERGIMEAAAAAQYEVRFWDCSQGLTDAEGKPQDGGPQLADPNAIVRYIRDSRERCCYVLRDLHKWLDPIILRGVRSLARQLQSAPRREARAIVVLTPSSEIPPELAGHAVVVDWPLPQREEVASILDDVLRSLPPDLLAGALQNGERERAIDAAVGLTAEEVASCYARSLVATKRIDPAVVSSEKRRVIAREKVLTWYEPEARGLSAVGGLDCLKRWLEQRRMAFSQKARLFGLPAPKGLFLAGLPGTGKSLTAKTVAAEWGMPLLRLDMGALRSKWVGESEGNIRRALATAEAVAPAILWLDEIEKALAGASGQQGDGGVAADALGTVLSWMQERQAPVFVVATANDVRALPPELLRKGRFDEMFFLDLPTTAERVQIAATAMRQYSRDPTSVDLQALARATEGFVGAEIAALVPDALFVAFGDGAREVSTADLLAMAANCTPLSRTSAEKVRELRDWAKGRARPASTPETAQDSGGRKIDL